jgi:hypothetical protein
MVKGEDLGNGCLGDGFCYSRRDCEYDCDQLHECLCGRRHTIYRYIRHEECPHNCQLLECKCGELVPQYELDVNGGQCNKCADVEEDEQNGD